MPTQRLFLSDYPEQGSGYKEPHPQSQGKKSVASLLGLTHSPFWDGIQETGEDLISIHVFGFSLKI
jgi:hypothetical protein